MENARNAVLFDLSVRHWTPSGSAAALALINDQTWSVMAAEIRV